MNLKEIFNDKFYDDLVKCNFLKDIEEILTIPGMISIDLDDFVKISDGSEIVGSISQYFETLDEDYIISRISNKVPTDSIIYFSSDNNLNLKDVDKLIDKLRKQFSNDVSIVFGATIDPRIKNKIRVQALLTYSNKPKEKVDYSELKKLEEETNKIVAKREQKWNDENDLVYNVALYCINNPIAVNGIQNQFGLGFNRTIAILNRLEKLEIISIKLGTKPREILIKNEEEIKNRIYTIK